MEAKNRKTLIVTLTIVITYILVVATTYAIMTTHDQKSNKFVVGSLDIQIQNLDLKKNNTSTRIVMPGDIDTLSWTAKNVGKNTALTRHVLDVYWANTSNSVGQINELTEADASSLLVLYPATMSNEEIMEDYNGTKAHQLTPIEAFPTQVSKVVNGETITVYGIRYKFVGDTLEGTEPQGIASSTSQDISFKVLLSPETSYLYQNQPIKVDVLTEAMQYTEQESGTWTVTDNESI